MQSDRPSRRQQLKESLRPRAFSFAAGLVVAFLIAVLTSAASPRHTGGAAPKKGFVVGVADNNAFLTPDTRGPNVASDLGLTAVRLFVWYQPGQTALTPEQRQELGWAVAGGRRVIASVTGQPIQGKPRWIRPEGISTAAGRRAYVSFLRDLVHTFPAIKDVSVWNEPNYPLFWSKRKNAPQSYAALMAASYDVLHPLGVRVFGFELHPWEETARWIKGVGAWMRAAHRKRPLFDFVATHPYPMARNEAPWARHRKASILAMGDVHRLRGLLHSSFARTAQRRLQVFYTETGWTTAASSPLRVTPAQQATRMVEAVELASCQRDVRSMISFLVADAPDQWQTGVIDSSWSVHKPVYDPYKAAIGRIRAGKVKCSQFSRATL